VEAEEEDRGSTTLDANHDVVRFGKSLQSLEEVLLEDFANTFVETLLMERAKFAGYLMRCSSLLDTDGSEEHEDEALLATNTSMLSASSTMSTASGGDKHCISSDLRETARALHRFLRVCDEVSAVPVDDNDLERARRITETAQYAPRLMRGRVLELVAKKLMEVAMDYHGMSPDLLHYGCTVFAADVEALFASSPRLPPLALRLVDVTKLMAMESNELAQIGQALCGLAGQPAPLTEQVFEGDDRLYEEAMSMIRVKGLLFVELEDVLGILNRRRELNAGF